MSAFSESSGSSQSNRMAENTSDEDQDDLSYDGDLGNQSVFSEGNVSSDGSETVRASPYASGLFESNKGTGDHVKESSMPVEHKPVTLSQVDSSIKQNHIFGVSKPSDFLTTRPSPADINQMLLQHFPPEELLQTEKLIEAETLPDVSLLDSVDDGRDSIQNSEHPESIASNSEVNPCSDRNDEKSNTVSKNSCLESAAQRKTDITSLAQSITSSSKGIGNISVVSEQEKTEDDTQRVPLVRTRSLSEMKYGQGRVNYPLRDFSKVAPKVKIPKVPRRSDRSAPKGVGKMHRTKSSPEMLDVISRVLEDLVQPCEKQYVLKDADESHPGLVHHLEAEHDKLISKYAGSQTFFGEMKSETIARPSSELMHLGCSAVHQGNLPTDKGRHLESLVPHLRPSGNTTVQINATERSEASCRQPEESPSDGERMTAELRDIVSEFMQKVEGFKLTVSHMPINTTEQHMCQMLRSIMEAQDQLERKYISKKEEHRTLEMQNYMGVSRNTGSFDPDRLVEGDIFRIGMYIEDIKEMIDRNMCEQISSTPTSTKEMLHVKPLTSTPLPPPSLHEVTGADFSTVDCKTDTQKAEEKTKIMEEDSEVDGDIRLQPSSELITLDSLLKNTRSRNYISRSTQGLDIQTDEDEEESSSALSEALDHSNILAYLSGARSSSRLSQKSSESHSTLEVVQNPVGISEPSFTTSSASQIVRAETDSGFGSSYLNQSACGPFQPNLLMERVQSQNDALSSSGSEGCRSNPQSVQAAAPTSQRWDRAQPPGAAAAVEQWVESTITLPSVRLQEQARTENTPLTQLHHHISDPIISTVAAEERSSPLHSCSCSSKTILDLQSQVCMLKKHLQESLVQVPYIAEEMGYLMPKNKQECRSKSRTRSHHSSAYSSVRELMKSRQNVEILSSTQTDPPNIDPSKRKVNTSLLEEDKDAGPYSHAKQRPQTSIMDYLNSKKQRPIFSSPHLQKPLLQVSYTSSSSLPASYKMREVSVLQTTSHRRKLSTQSDAALLPSNVYFQRTPSPVLVPPQTCSKAGRHRESKEEEINKTLDLAIEVARSMKRTTDKMAKRLAADLAKTPLHRK